jgi:hypothetical protein
MAGTPQPYNQPNGNDIGVVSDSPIGVIAGDSTQAQAGADLYAMGQQAQTPPAPPSKTGHGWSLTNPFQDAGQIWHDVETHTIAPVMNLDREAYSKFVSRPLATLAIYGAKTYQGLTQGTESFGAASGFSGSQWAQSWDAANHISPGQGVVLSLNNSFSAVNLATGTSPTSQTSPVHPIDPFNPTEVQQVFKPTVGDPNYDYFHRNAWGNKIASGSVDAIASFYGDPLGKLGKGGKVVRLFKDAPIRPVDNAVTVAKKLNAPRSLAFNDWALGRDASQIAEHPMVKGTAARLNPYRYQLAALIAGARTPEEIALIREIAAGSPAAQAQLSDLGETTAHALDKLGKVSPDAASQVANLFIPAETMEKFALSSDTWANNISWLQDVSRAKVSAAQAQLNQQADLIQQILKMKSTMSARTTSTFVAEKLAELRGTAKYANTRNVDQVSFLHRALYNFPVRIYQGLNDMPEGLINHRDDQAVQQARSWLNKSKTLTPDEKNEFLQQYASAAPADRQRVWDGVENDVYSKVGDKYGVSPEVMKRILTTTQQRGRGLARAAQSKDYGAINLGDGTSTAVLPTADSEVLMHPRLITQLEAGAVPLANLHNLENALKTMDRNGFLGHVANKGADAYDLMNYAFERVYGIWRPMSLLTGHRAYNHIGDDWLRGVAKLGGLATVANARDGAANWIRNRGARFTRDKLVANLVGAHEKNIADAKAEWEGLAAQARDQAGDTPDDLWVSAADVQAKKDVYDQLRKMGLPEIPPKHRLGEGTFKIPGSNIDWEEAFGGPNGDYWRQLTSSQHTWDSLADDSAHRLHSVATAARLPGFGEIRAVDDPARHTRAYLHYIKNQLMPDPMAKQIVAGKDLGEVSRWLSDTAAGRQHMRDLHVGDPDDFVTTVSEMIKTYLPNDTMRTAALTGKFNRELIETEMPNAGQRPHIHANLNTMLHGGDPTVGMLKRSMDTMMKWTGTLPDDIMVRHPVFNSLYKSRLTDDVKSWISQSGSNIIDADMANQLMQGARLGARKDMQNLLYDVSRFNDLGHTLRFVSPFFNAWFNAMSTWSRLFAENPGLVARTYEAKRALWDSPFSINKNTGQPADDKTNLSDLAFVFHAPKAMHGMLGGLTTIPIDGSKLISPTYIDSIGSPGFGPLVAAPVNQMVKYFPSQVDNPIVKSILNGIIDKNSLATFVPSGVRDSQMLSTVLAGNAPDNASYAKTVWSIYQEQYWDYLNGQRVKPPNWNYVESQATYLSVLDTFVNRLLPLGFKPAPAHQLFVDEYRNMQSQDPKNAMQNFYDKYGPAAMVFTQSLTADPSGIAATTGAAKAVGRYAGLLSQFPELGGVIVGPEGNGNFDDMAYQWEVARGLRTQLTPQEAASKAMINLGWAAYGKARAGIQAQMMAKGIKSLNEPAAKQLKAELSSYVARFGDRNDPIYNPDFYSNFASFDPNQYQMRIGAILQIAQDPALLANGARGDIRALQAYSQLRDYTYAALQRRQYKTLNSASNFDIARAYDLKVAELMARDTRFAQMYDRYLSRDDWKEPL